MKLREGHGPDPHGEKHDAAGDQAGIEGNVGRVIEVDSPIAFEPGLVQPPKSGRIDQHQHAVNPRIEPHGRPVPEEKAAHEQPRDRQQKQQDGPPRPLADHERHAGNEHDRRQGKDDGRNQIISQHEGSANFERLLVGHEVVANDHEHDVRAEHDQKRGEHGPELGPHVFAHGQRGGAEQVGDLQLVVADQRHAGRNGEKESVPEKNHDDQHLADGEFGGDPRLGAAHSAVTRGDLQRPTRQPIRGESQDQDQDPEEGPTKAVEKVEPKDPIPASCAHMCFSIRDSGGGGNRSIHRGGDQGGTRTLQYATGAGVPFASSPRMVSK